MSESGNVSPGYYVTVEDTSTQTYEEDFIPPSPTREASNQTCEEDFNPPSPTRKASTQTCEEDFIPPSPTRKASTQTCEEDLIPPSPTREASTQTEDEDFIEQTTDEDFRLLSHIEGSSEVANLADSEENGSNFRILQRKRSHHSERKDFLENLGTPKVVPGSKKICTPEAIEKRQSVSKIPNCAKCGKRFLKESSLMAHLLSSCDPLPFKCGHCDAKYKYEWFLIRHQQVHSAERPFKCTQCDYASKRQSNLNTHIKRHHGNSLLVEN